MAKLPIIDYANNLINGHRVASSIIAAGLLASVSFVSASAIGVHGQITKDSLTVPTGYSNVKSRPKTEQVQPNTASENADNAAKPAVLGAASQKLKTTAKTPSTAPAKPVVQAVPQPVAPVPVVQPQPSPETPIAQPSFTITFGETSSYTDFITGNLVILLPFNVNREPGHTAELILEAAIISPTGNHGVSCEISTKAGEGHKIGSVRLIATPTSAAGTYTCAFSISDGVIAYEGSFEAKLISN